MRVFLIIISVMIGATTKAKEVLMDASSERGFFSLGLNAAYDHSRLLNTDGTYSSYAGYLGGIQIDITLFKGVSFFFQYNTGLCYGEQTSSDILNKTETFAGAKTYTDFGLFMGGGISNYMQSIKTNSATTNLNQSLTSIFTGVDVQMSENWILESSVWYKLGPIKKSDNTNLTSNSYSDSVQLQIVFIWSPPSMTTKYIKNN